MKQYDRFGEYMFDLLFAPLKKGKRAVKGLYVAFKYKILEKEMEVQVK